MISTRELRNAAEDRHPDTVLRSHDYICEAAADTIDGLLALIHDANKPGEVPLWAALDEEVRFRIEENLLRLAEAKVEYAAEQRRILIEEFGSN